MLGTLAVALAVAAPSPVAGTSATAACGRTGIPYPQNALARGGPGSLWLACRERGTVLRFDDNRGIAGKAVKTPGTRPWAVAAGFGALWVIDRNQPVLLKIDTRTGKQRRVALASLPVAIWAGGGSVWVGFEQGSAVARIDPKTAGIRMLRAGDGASGFATDGKSVWIACHRDNSIARVDLATGRVTTIAEEVAEPQTTAAERIAYAEGSLWVTGRGLDLLRLDATTGHLQATVEIGAAGIDVLHLGSRLLVAAATETGARRGDPVVSALLSVDPTTNSVVARFEARARVLLSGFVGSGQRFWLADTVGGRLIRGRLS